MNFINFLLFYTDHDIINARMLLCDFITVHSCVYESANKKLS
jgi:hypothetical protein